MYRDYCLFVLFDILYTVRLYVVALHLLLITPRFTIYISDVHTVVEQKVPESQSISFVYDVTWFVEGNSIEEVTKRLEKYAAEILGWAERNAVRFEKSKTEAILLSRRHGHG